MTSLYSYFIGQPTSSPYSGSSSTTTTSSSSTTPVQRSGWSVGGVSESSGAGFIDGAGKAVLKLLADPGTRATLNETLFAVPPQEIRELRELLDIALKRPDELILEDVKKIATLISTSLGKFNLPTVSSLSDDLSERPDLQKLGLTKDKLTILFTCALMFTQAHTEIADDEDTFSRFVHIFKTHGKANLRICARIVASLEKALYGPVPRTFQALDENTTREPHKNLTNLKSLISRCKAHPRDIPVTLLVLHIDRLIQEQDSIFIEPLLSERDERQLMSLWKYFKKVDPAFIGDNLQADPAFIDDNLQADPEFIGDNLHKLETLIERMCEEQSGTIAKAGQVVNKTIIDPPLSRVEQLPTTLKNQIFGTSTTSSFIPNSSFSLDNPEREVAAGGWFSFIGSWLASSSLTVGTIKRLKTIVEQIDNQIDDAQFPSQSGVVGELLDMIEELERAPTLDNLNEIKKYLLDHAHTLNAIKVAVHGFTLPAWMKIPEKASSERIDSRALMIRQRQQSEALFPKETFTAEQYKEFARQEKEKFKDKTVKFVLIKTLFGSDMTFADLCKVMQGADDAPDFKKEVLEALWNKQNVS